MMRKDTERAAMEKLVVARALSDLSFDGRRYRRSVDDCLAWLFREADLGTATYRVWDMLGGRRGRGDAMLEMVRGDLGLDDAGVTALADSMAPLYSANLGAARSRGQVVA